MATLPIPAKLQWACRRGMLELDILLGHFLSEVYPLLGFDKQAIFVRLLTYEDQDLFMWLTGKTVCPDPMINRMIGEIRRHANVRHFIGSI